MPSAVGHFIVGASIALPFAFSSRLQETMRPMSLVVFTGFLAMAPDADTLFHGVIPYAHFFGHRGFFHSPAFLALFALVISLALWSLVRTVSARQCAGLFMIFFLAMSMHSILDSMSDAGRGVMLLYPLSEERVFLSWRPFYTPPISVSALSVERVRMILHSEMYLVGGSLLLSGCLTCLASRLTNKGGVVVKETLPSQSSGCFAKAAIKRNDMVTGNDDKFHFDEGSAQK